ncbi:MAG TPA: glucose-6-phosphate dehydrogenase assembly protein OpcA [Chthoniobacterales bacterium]
MSLAQEISRGLPVEIDKISRSLKKLWEQEGEMLTKASLVNFAIYSEAPDALNVNSQLIEEVTRENACRAILIAANPSAAKFRVQAWISAHCHVSRAGAKQVCSEQVSILLDGGDHATMRNILFSNLDSDLPLFLWWQGQFPDEMDSQLWPWVDRMLYDSQAWREPAKQVRTLRATIAAGHSRTVPCDLNWRRINYLRLALAQACDHPWALEKLSVLDKVKVTYHPEAWTTGTLLVAWLASQLGWALRDCREDQFTFVREDGDALDVELKALPGPWVTQVQLAAGDHRLDLHWTGNFLTTSLSDHPELRQLSPAGGTTIDNLVREELVRGGEHKTYLNALDIAEQLWQAV